MTNTANITLGAQRLLINMGYATLCEMRLPNDRRVDIMGINKKGEIFIVEVKSSIEDFRSDQKWPEYLDWADFFAFAVDETFPTDTLPDQEGLIIADRFEGSLLRPATLRKLNSARRKSLILKFGRSAAKRLEPDGTSIL